jgi:hypothetical protein
MPDRDLDALFSAARRELAAQSPLVPELADKLAGTTPAPRRSLALPALFAVALLGTFAVWFFHTPKPPAYPLAPVSLSLDDVLITQRLACALDERTVLVAWTTSADLAAIDKPTRHHRYLEIPLRSAPTDGGTFHCSLFLADPGIHPELAPPTIVALLPDHRAIGFAASPTLVPSPNLAAAIHASAPAGVAPVTRHEIDAALGSHAASI